MQRNLQRNTYFRLIQIHVEDLQYALKLVMESTAAGKSGMNGFGHTSFMVQIQSEKMDVVRILKPFENDELLFPMRENSHRGPL